MSLCSALHHSSTVRLRALRLHANRIAGGGADALGRFLRSPEARSEHLRAINAMVKASEKKHANIMLYIKFPLAYMLTRKSAETDWSRYETATVRQKGLQASIVEVVDIATLNLTQQIQIPLIQMHKPSLRMDSSEAERMSELHLSHNRIGLLEARNLIRASCRRLPSESLSELESREPQSRVVKIFYCFKIFNISKCLEVIFF